MPVHVDDSDPAALDGLRVVDLSGSLAGALTAMVLGDNGADVITVEPPGGDALRRLPAYAMWHRGHRSVIADLTTVSGRERVMNLVRGADVVVQDWRPLVAGRLGLDHERLAEVNPRVVTCVMTGFGSSGPWSRIKGYEGVVSAKAGAFTVDGRPRFSPIPAGSFGAANGALQGVLAALYQREDTGRGQRVEASLLQGLTAFNLYDWLDKLVPPSLMVREGAVAGVGATVYPAISGLVAFTKDGRCVQFGNFLPHQLDAFLRATELEEWYRDGTERSTEEILSVARRRIHERTWEEWDEAFAREPNVAGEPHRTTEEATRHPQLVHNGDVIEIDDQLLGATVQLGALARLARTPARLGAGAPQPGEHDQTAHFPVADRVPVPAGAGTVSAPLAGVTILELAWFYAAPFGTALLADLGARVVKIENLEGDPHRSQSGVKEFAGVKALQGKESIAVDTSTPEGMEVLRKLVKRSDAVMRNFRQQAAVRMEIDYDALVSEKDDLVYLYAAAYGSTGPSAMRPAYAPTIGVGVGHQSRQLGRTRAFEGASGLAADEAERLGQETADRQTHVLVNADAGAALGVGTALMLALLAHRRHGIGQSAETSMLHTNAYVLSDDFLAYAGKEAVAPTDVHGLGTGALYRLYEAESGWVFLAVGSPQEWESFCAVIAAATDGRLRLDEDGRFTMRDRRAAHDVELADVLASVFGELSAARWEELMLAQDVACVQVNEQTLSEFTIEHPAMVENGFVGEVEHPHFGRHRRHGAIVTMPESPTTLGPGPLTGQHTRQVLKELGYSDGEIAELQRRGVVTWPGASAAG